MSRIKKEYIYKTTPVCKKEAVVCRGNFRCTVLTDRLLRMEYSKNGVFEDRATQTAINRDFDVPNFTVTEDNGTIRICTESVEVVYRGGKFSKNSLFAQFYGENGGSRYVWYYGDNEFNLKGTARTLDTIDGECELEDGIMARPTMTMLDDSKSLILADDGWVDVREEGNVDIYLFAYREDYLGALKAFSKLTGNTPLIPRFALGNWWSRFYKYTQDEYKELMYKFEEKGIPFSVAVIDMDWHYTDIPKSCGSGWTGFSWNKELFPDHKEFLKFLHNRNMEVTLNLHPAEGIAAHEDCYEEMAKSMGIDPDTKKTVDFDIADPKFLENYFEHLIHPMEDDGVSFWWMDWQQGNTTKLPGLDPLWMLNHYHFVDMCGQNKRAMIFSRYSGAGSHRYPIGFSGDTIVTWDSLDFQPYFTSTASNIGYGWWSHDIGGHMNGTRDDELVTRWVQYGVFSPIMRLHSACNDFQSKEPWHYNQISETVMTDFLRLRHKMIPYMYSMNYRSYNECEPLVMPIYYRCTDDRAYTYNRNEYYFGTEMIVSPITQKADSVTEMGCANTYLPDGEWFDFFNGRQYSGNRCYKMYRELYTIPVLVKAGGIVPLSKLEEVNDISNPKNLEIQVFPGADNSFTLYEDDGTTMEYENDICSKTELELKWRDKREFIIKKPVGDKKIIIADRGYTVVFRNISEYSDLSVTENGTEKQYNAYVKDGSLYVILDNVNDEVNISFNAEIADNNVKKDVFDILLRAQWDNVRKETVYNLLKKSENAADFVNGINAMDIDSNLYNALVEVSCAKN